MQKVSNLQTFEPKKKFLRAMHLTCKKFRARCKLSNPQKSFACDAFGVQKVSCTMQTFEPKKKFLRAMHLACKKFRARCMWRAKKNHVHVEPLGRVTTGFAKKNRFQISCIIARLFFCRLSNSSRMKHFFQRSCEKIHIHVEPLGTVTIRFCKILVPRRKF